MCMTEFELSPFRVIETLPALRVGRKSGDVIPTDWFIGPAQRLCHRAPHRESNRSEHGLCALTWDKEFSVAVPPDAVGFIHPGLIARTPDNRLAVAIQDGRL